MTNGGEAYGAAQRSGGGHGISGGGAERKSKAAAGNIGWPRPAGWLSAAWRLSMKM